MHCPKAAILRGGPRRGVFRNEVDPNSTPRWMLVVVGYRMGTITSFPLGDPVLLSSTTAGITSDSDTMRPIAGTSWTRSIPKWVSNSVTRFELASGRTVFQKSDIAIL